MVIIVMGVCGTGKTEVGVRLARRLGAHFVEGDEYHSPENVEKMRSGTPLTDQDRWPWLHEMAAAIDAWRAEGRDAVLACSALKKAYRDILMGGRDDVVAVHLTGPRDLIEQRLAGRKGHYMPPTLLPSQLATLEPPDETENAFDASIAGEPDEIVDRILPELWGRGLIR
jgi:gluconokinase